MNVKDELEQLPLVLQFVLKGFGAGAVLGVLFAAAMLVQFLTTPDQYRSEMLFEGAGLYMVAVGFPTSLIAYPIFFFAPWVGMILLPAVNCALLAFAGYGVYRLTSGLSYFRDL